MLGGIPPRGVRLESEHKLPLGFFVKAEKSGKSVFSAQPSELTGKTCGSFTLWDSHPPPSPLPPLVSSSPLGFQTAGPSCFLMVMPWPRRGEPAGARGAPNSPRPEEGSLFTLPTPLLLSRNPRNVCVVVYCKGFRTAHFKWCCAERVFGCFRNDNKVECIVVIILQ